MTTNQEIIDRAAETEFKYVSVKIVRNGNKKEWRTCVEVYLSEIEKTFSVCRYINILNEVTYNPFTDTIVGFAND